ncbi:MAG: CHAT domain-containing protein [Xenococcaceae cyanobacterium]
MKLRVTHRWRSLFVISLILSLLLGQVSFAQASEPSQLVQQGVEEYQSQQYRQAIDSWNQALTTYQEIGDRASTVIVLENLARAYQKIGQTEKAIAFWQEVEDNYTQLGDIQQLARSLTEQAQAYSRLGQHLQASALLCGTLENANLQRQRETEKQKVTEKQKCLSGSAIALARQQEDILGEVAALGSLGEAYRFRGNYEQALSYLQNSLKLAKTINNPHLEISALNSLGNTYSSLAQVSYRRASSAQKRGEIYGENSLLAQYTQEGRKQDERAKNYFQQSLRLATGQQNPLSEIKAIISSLPIYYRLEQYSAAEALLKQTLTLLPSLPPQQETIYAKIDLAKLLQPQKITPDSCFNSTTLPQARELLQQAVSLARSIDARRGESFALGELGHTYECSQNYQQALELTQQARLAAEKDRDSLYLWEWQTGRILIKQGNKKAGIATYERAIATLESIRGDILTANRDIQFDFRDTVEPIYRQLIEQRLDEVSNSLVIKPTETNLANNVTSILNTVDSLRIAELQNYFGNDCALKDATLTTVDATNPDLHTVYFNSIILDNRTAIIAMFPGRKTKVIWHQQNRQAIEQEINEFRRNLERFRDNYEPKLGQNIYQWLISPFDQDLEQAEIKTLVFVQDGLLRSIPMAALHDGEKFLIEKYAIATTPSLNLTNPETLNRDQRKLALRDRLRALVLGLTEASQIDGRKFAPLPNVQQEISQVKDILIESKGFINEEFTRDRLQQELAETFYPIIHIATHGQFGSEPEDTFLVTGNEEKLTLTELDRIIRSTIPSDNPVELISLTACQTAVGDERAALGLAGVAVQAGVNSALASLWSISDEATPQIIQQFYASLKDSRLNKAEALRQAQIASIDRGIHPAYWASFIIIGNWL